MRPRRWLIVGGIVVALGLALGVGVDIARTGGLDAWLAQRGGAPAYDARGRTLTVAGAAVYLDCRGTGSPVVILETGFGGGAAGWGPVLDGVAAFTRVCAWDRPGIGRSEARPLHSAGDTAELLRATLLLAGEPGPFVVVAHSLGGVYARLFDAAGQPGRSPEPSDAVVGFVMIETFEPDLGVDVDPLVPEAVRANVRQALEDVGTMVQEFEGVDWAATLTELEALGPIEQPGVTLWVDPDLRFGEPDPDDKAAIVAAWYRGIAARYPNMTIEIVPNTDHTIQLVHPSLVIDRIREVVLTARAAAPYRTAPNYPTTSRPVIDGWRSQAKM